MLTRAAFSAEVTVRSYTDLTFTHMRAYVQ